MTTISPYTMHIYPPLRSSTLLKTHPSNKIFLIYCLVSHYHIEMSHVCWQLIKFKSEQSSFGLLSQGWEGSAGVQINSDHVWRWLFILLTLPLWAHIGDSSSLGADKTMNNVCWEWTFISNKDISWWPSGICSFILWMYYFWTMWNCPMVDMYA